MHSRNTSWSLFCFTSSPRKHVTDFGVNMASKLLHGYCTLNLTCLECGTDTITLDTRGLKILAVELLGSQSISASKLEWKLGETDPVLGQPLTASLPGGCKQGDTLSVGVGFEVDESSSALQFLEPQQTSGKNHPFLFTQCQAIHARALVPCQVRYSSHLAHACAMAPCRQA